MKKKKTTLAIVYSLVGLAALCMQFTLYAQTPTPEQLRQFEQLTPAQRTALMRELGGSSTVQQQQRQPELTVITPRSAPTESFESTEPVAGEGLEGLAITKEPGSASPLLKRFGYDLFAGEPTTFAPAADIPIPVDYIVGPGDTIELQLFGSQNAFYSLVVTREGVLNFPELGPITVSGLRFSDLRVTLQERVSEQMIGVRASITMGRLRSIRIFILGDAYRPGSYTISSLSTMTNALLVSGGINPIGSLRNVQLKRNGRLIQTLDLYDLLLRGDTSADTRLQPGDVIFIPPVGRTVGVDGEVRRPAIYELRAEKTVDDVLELAGGLLPTAYPQASQIERINDKRERTIIDVDLTIPEGLGSTLSADDTIRIYSILEKREDIVLLSGHVYRTGSSQWHAGMRLTDLISSQQELLPNADLDYVVVRRETLPGRRIEVFSTDISAALAEPGSNVDVLLKPRDQVSIFSLNQDPVVAPSEEGEEVLSDRVVEISAMVEELRQQASIDEPEKVVGIHGHVRFPGEYPLESGMRISRLLRAGGNLMESAYRIDAEMLRFVVTGAGLRETTLIRVDLAGVLAGDLNADLMLKPHDYLNIKKIPNWLEQNMVEVAGEVLFPGTYPITIGERIYSLIERAGGLNTMAFPEGAVFLRPELLQREQMELEEMQLRLESEAGIAAASMTDDPESQAAREALLARISATVATGRLVIDLPQILNDPTTEELNIVLGDGDRLLIPRRSQTVTIIGEVQYPTSHVFEPNISRNSYIDKSGGTTRQADKSRIYTVRADGQVLASTGSRFFRGSGARDVEAGDTIVVPIDSEQLNQLTLWGNISTILYNISVAAAAVGSF